MNANCLLVFLAVLLWPAGAPLFGQGRIFSQTH